MKPRHNFLKNEDVITRYGTARLDHQGFVVNMDDLTGSPQQVVANCPGFVDGAVFPPKESALPAPPAGAPKAVTAPPVKTGPTDEEFGKVIKELLEKGAAVTTEGYIDMGALNQELRERKMPVLTGRRRIEISDAMGLAKKAEEGKLPATDA